MLPDLGWNIIFIRGFSPYVAQWPSRRAKAERDVAGHRLVRGMGPRLCFIDGLELVGRQNGTPSSVDKIRRRSRRDEKRGVGSSRDRPNIRDRGRFRQRHADAAGTQRL